MSEQEDLNAIEEQKKKLSAMEEAIKSKADEVDIKATELAEQKSEFESDMEKKTAAFEKERGTFEKKLGIVDASAVFDSMVKTVNELYTAYYAVKGTDEGLLEALQSILNARKSINKV